MVELIIALIMALISYFTAKKKGNASDTQAALAAAAAGIGTYYVATETEWGKSAVSSLSSAIGYTPSSANSTTATTASGEKVAIPKQSGTTSTNAWDVLKTWGPTGTAAAVGTTALGVSGSLQKYLPWIAIGAVALLIFK